MTTKLENGTSRDKNINLMLVHAVIWGILLGPFVAGFLNKYAANDFGIWIQVIIYIVIGVMSCRFMFIRGEKFQKAIKSCADLGWNCWALAGIFILMKKCLDGSNFDWPTLFDLMGLQLTAFVLSGVALTATIKASAAAFEVLSTLLAIRKRRKATDRPAT